MQALGFEIILSRAKTGTTSNDDSCTSSSAWLRYDEKLKGYNYYKGFIEGSKPYKELEQRAKAFFETNLNQEGSDHPEDLLVRDLQALIQSSDIDLEALKRKGSSLPPDDGTLLAEYIRHEFIIEKQLSISNVFSLECR